jgi:hypothetical protein
MIILMLVWRCYPNGMVMALGVNKGTINSDKSFFMVRKEKAEILLVDILSLYQSGGLHQPIG